MDDKTTRHLPVVCWQQPIDSGGYQRLLCIVWRGRQQPISPGAITVVTQTIGLDTQCKVHCCMWAYVADTQIAVNASSRDDGIVGEK
ncbi:hypothetical protein TNCV_259561 [Trichonephila clavipes]|uniref:Uncharacterized protein n=1 Tax=Trichonephila clavipes TaxID=2585209 RepID=A0A8X6RW74_TRICX|nr:hypothetical protein TNCV_259561 [Trichonephila clavipes]